MSTDTRRRSATNDLRDQPAYPLAEAARYLKLSPATLRTWVSGRNYPTADGIRRWPRLVVPATVSPPALSFWNLIEAHVLWGLRTDHAVSIGAVRQSLQFAQRELRIDRLLLRHELCTTGGELFLEHYGALIQLSASGQIALRQVFEAHLRRVEWDEWHFPVRLFPFVRADGEGDSRAIAIDPGIEFGRPIVLEKGIRTEVLTERIDAGETIAEVAADYDLDERVVRDAIIYEHAA